MKFLVGILLGCFVAFPVMWVPGHIIEGQFGYTWDEALKYRLFFASWLLSMFIIVRGARSVSAVFSRAFLLSAAAFFASAVIWPVVILTGPPPEMIPAGGAAVAGAIMFLVPAGICLIGSKVANNYGRNMASLDAWLAGLDAKRRANGGARGNGSADADY